MDELEYLNWQSWIDERHPEKEESEESETQQWEIFED